MGHWSPVFVPTRLAWGIELLKPSSFPHFHPKIIPMDLTYDVSRFPHKNHPKITRNRLLNQIESLIPNEFSMNSRKIRISQDVLIGEMPRFVELLGHPANEAKPISIYGLSDIYGLSGVCL